ncbi:MAG: molybdopterin-dependent oxidoreductase [Proteobacteria bacterium]|nr:molybdopterin-dependent oxidoreductase [Pseudomonadota bacterium]
MSEWKTTSCALCAQNCGLQVLVENNTIKKVRADKKNPRSRGYICRKGVKVAHYHHHGDRLTHPLKRTDKGFERISWDQAVSEIAEKLKDVVDRHGPKSFAFMGGGGQGMHFEAAFGRTFMKALGSKYHYNALAQELTGYYWLCGHMFGRQNRSAVPDEHNADMILAVGWNGMTSHQMVRAPRVLKAFSRDPDKLLVVIDPRKSETARLANKHIALRPGSDALLVRAIIAIIITQGWEDKDYIRDKTSGFGRIRPWFEDFKIKAALDVCDVDYDEVFDLCRLLTTRKWCMHFDLGVLMGRESTLATYLYMLLSAICGRYLVPGGNVIPGSVVRKSGHTDNKRLDAWRTVETDFPAILGLFPPNVMPEEIMSEKPDRLRAVLVCGANPLRSYADTTAYEGAFEKLDLLVTIEMSMTETAELSDYVLPIRSAYESYDATFFTLSFPEVYFQLRRPVLEPEHEREESGEILSKLARAMGMVPDLPNWLYEAAKKDDFEFQAALFSYILKNRKAAEVLPFILSDTLGRELGSTNLAMAKGLFWVANKDVRENAKRAGFVPDRLSTVSPHRVGRALKAMVRYKSPAPLALLLPRFGQAEMIYDSVMRHPEGFWIGKVDPDNNMSEIYTKDRRINLHIPKLNDWMAEITPDAEKKDLEPDPEYPFILSAGRHKPENANTLMRNPSWNKGRRACTLAMHPNDAKKLEVDDGEIVMITTEAASENIELEVTDHAREGQVLIPHGFGLNYNGTHHGVNVNRLTKNTHRDRIAGTPLHRYVKCRIEKIGSQEGMGLKLKC